MAGYFIANFTIRDREKFKQYWELSPAIKDFGVRPLVRQRNPIVLHGEPQQVIVVFEFESVEAVKRWYESPEYRAVEDLWVESVEGWAIIAGEVLDLENLNPAR